MMIIMICIFDGRTQSHLKSLAVSSDICRTSSRLLPVSLTMLKEANGFGKITAVIGAETGLVKRVRLSRANANSPVVAAAENLNKVSPGDRERLEVVSICPTKDDMFLVGRKDGTVSTFMKKTGILMDDAEGTRYVINRM
jgi:hypothetical protein